MPSTVHQTLLLWLARKITADGFVLTACDGSLPRGGAWNRLPRPIEAFQVRPDAYAVAPRTNAFAFAEAKTESDILNAHTRGQLRVLGALVRTGGRDCRLYIAVPRSAAAVLDRVVHEANLAGTPQLIRMHVPDCLLEDDRHECA